MKMPVYFSPDMSYILRVRGGSLPQPGETQMTAPFDAGRTARIAGLDSSANPHIVGYTKLVTLV